MKKKKISKEEEIEEVLHLFRNKGLKPTKISDLTGRSIRTIYRWLNHGTPQEKSKDLKSGTKKRGFSDKKK